MSFGTLPNLIIDDPRAGIFRVNRAAMVLPEVFEAEKRRIFDKVWLYLGHASEVPRRGDFKLRTMVGRPLILCRGDDDKVRVFINSCPHRGAEVCQEASGNKRVFSCPYHSWTFRNTGELIDVLAEDGYGGVLDRREFGLREVPRMTNYRGFVFICYDPAAQPLETYLGGSRIYLDYVADQAGEGRMEIIRGSQLYSARANWKLLVENTIDFYHTVPLHKTYFRFLEKSGSDISGGVAGNGYDLGGGHAVVSFSAGWGRPVARWQPSWGEAEKKRIAEVRAAYDARFGAEHARMVCEVDRNLCIFPNLLINDILATVVRQVNPIYADYMEITQWAIAPVGESAESRARRLQAFNTFLGPGGFATPDDIEAFEACQRGFSAHRELGWSDYSRGYLGEAERPDHLGNSSYERQLRAFYRQWARLLSDEEGGAKVRPGLAAAAQ